MYVPETSVHHLLLIIVLKRIWSEDLFTGSDTYRAFLLNERNQYCRCFAPYALFYATYLSSDVAGFQAVISFRAVTSILLLLASQLFPYFYWHPWTLILPKIPALTGVPTICSWWPSWCCLLAVASDNPCCTNIDMLSMKSCGRAVCDLGSAKRAKRRVLISKQFFFLFKNIYVKKRIEGYKANEWGVQIWWKCKCPSQKSG